MFPIEHRKQKAEPMYYVLGHSYGMTFIFPNLIFPIQRCVYSYPFNSLTKIMVLSCVLLGHKRPQTKIMEDIKLSLYQNRIERNEQDIW